jgi:hypothetical protein
MARHLCTPDCLIGSSHPQTAHSAQASGSGTQKAEMPEINEPTIALGDVLRPTVLHVDLARLTANYELLRRHAGVPVLVVLKANAYGHGLVEVGRHFDLLGAPYLGVAYLEEGLRLRQAGVRVPILVMGGIVGEQIPLVRRERPDPDGVVGGQAERHREPALRPWAVRRAST